MIVYYPNKICRTPQTFSNIFGTENEGGGYPSLCGFTQLPSIFTRLV